MRCNGCGRDVPDGNYCVVCGTPAAAEARTRAGAFAAAPHERAATPRLISTLFPHLPRSSYGEVTLLLAVGLAVVVSLGLRGLFPLAIVMAAALVPILVVLYLYDVNLYEDKPGLVVASTMLWGALTGVAFGLITRAIGPSGVDLVTASTGSKVVIRGFVLPGAATLVMLAGPLALLPYRKFNDVLDGVTFGSAAAVAFAGASTLTLAAPLLRIGYRPVGSVTPWILHLIVVAIGVPVIAACAIGAAAGTFWLRYRAPVADRAALGPTGRPAVGLGVALVLMIAAGIVQVTVSPAVAVVLLFVIALAGLSFLRRTIHVGLLEEAAEQPIGPPVKCANCGNQTPLHSFCATCGISIRALPKGPTMGTPRAAPEGA